MFPGLQIFSQTLMENSNVLSCFLFSGIIFVSYFLMKRYSVRIDTGHNLLLVTAHPDDELMFFGPMLLNEIRARIQEIRRDNSTKQKNWSTSKVHLVCLSNGNYYGDGQLRQQEFNNACHQLWKSSFFDLPDLQHNEQLEKEIFQWQIVQDEELMDSPTAEWSPTHIYMILMDYIKQNQITKLVTFDHYGISGHANHRAIYEAARKLDPSTLNNKRELEIWLLESVSIIRKYLSAFDILFTGLETWWQNSWNGLHFLNSLKDYLYLVQSLRKHQSQMVWFRYLYSSTSRYMFINTFKRLR